MSYTQKSGCGTPVLKSLLGELGELLELLQSICDEDYRHKDCASEAPIEGSPGEHTRHALDHISAVLGAVSELKESNSALPSIFYDRRERNTAIEKDRLLCIEKIEDYIEKLGGEGLDDLLQRDVKIEHMLDAKGNYAFFPSNLERELMFVSHHLIHHKAFIAVKLRLLRRHLDPAFGIAPATQNQLERA